MSTPSKTGLSSEVKVGLLFFAGLGLATWFTFFTTDAGNPKGQYTIPFRSVTQLKQGDAVTYNGVRVGTVTEVVPAREGDRAGVRVGFAIEPRFHDAVLVDGNAVFRIVLATLGGATMDIRSVGGQPLTQESLQGQRGVDGAGISEAVASVQGLVEENRPGIKEAIESFGQASAQVRDLVAENRETVKKAMENFEGMAAQIRDLVSENRETVAKAIENFKEMSGQIETMVRENREDVRTAVAALPEAVQNFRDAAKRIEELLAENQEDVRAAVRNIAQFAPKLDKIGDNLEIITRQIAEGKGSVGKLVFDDRLHDSALEAAESFNDRLDEVKPITQGLSQLRLAGYLDGGLNAKSGAAFGYAGLQLEPRPWKFFSIGLSYRTAPSDRDTLPNTKDNLAINVDLLIGWRFFPDDDSEVYRLSVAAGAIESQFGARVEVPVWGDRLILTGMARMKDSEKPVLDREYEEGDVLARAYLSCKPLASLPIWIEVGGDDLVDDPGLWVGLRGVLYDDDFRNLLGAASFGN